MLFVMPHFFSPLNVITQVEKNVFVVFYSGERAKTKILKICEAFGANRYSFAEDLGKQAQMITEVWAFLMLDLCLNYLLSSYSNLVLILLINFLKVIILFFFSFPNFGVTTSLLFFVN